MRFSSAARKFTRGVDQITALLLEVRTFEEAGAYRFANEIDVLAPNRLMFRCSATERKPVPDDWALRAGEAIGNLRASLDHVVYAATSRPSEHISFPICADPTRFGRARRKRLDGIPDVMVATIERAQPYKTLPEAPALDGLAILQKLSNIDKHRSLTTVACAVHSEAIGINNGIEISWDERATNKALGGGVTQLSRFTATADTAIDDRDVQPMFSYRVHIEQMRFSMLTAVVRSVYRALAECETGARLSPFAEYPL